MKKKLLLVEHGGDAKNFIFDVLKEKEIDLFVVTTKAPAWLSEYVSENCILIADTYNPESLIDTVNKFTHDEKIKFDGVGTFFEHVVVQTSLLAEALNCTNISSASAKRSSANKLAMREACVANGIPTPKFEIIKPKNVSELKEFILRFGLPCVVKPIFGSQSFGVKKFEEGFSDEDLEEIFSLTSSNRKEVFKNFDNLFLLEEYLSGTVVSVDGFVQNNEISMAGVIQFFMGPEPHFTQEANMIPADLNDDTKEHCFDFAEKVLQALGFDNCGFHCEMRITENGPRLIEIACRLPGGPLQLGYQHAYGYVLASNLVDIWLDEDTYLDKRYENFVVQKAVFPRSRGTIKTITGLDGVKSLPGVWDFVQISHPDEEIITYPEVPKPFYYYAVEAESIDKLRTLISQVESTVAVEVI